MIRVIGRPIVTDQPRDQFGWPVWDFVKRKFERNCPGVDAEVTLASMPAIPRFSSIDGPYGLWWRTGFASSALGPGDRLGLTIPGLHHLSEQLGPTLRELPAPLSAIFRILGDAAKAENDLDSETWWSVTRGALDLRGLMGSWPHPPVEIIGRVLQHEYGPLAIPTANFDFELPLGDGRFTALAGVADVRGYLSRLDGAVVPEPVALPTSPLALPAVLDYVGRILCDHPMWETQRFLRLPDFFTASLVTQVPTNQAEFEQRLSALWTIIGHLYVPQAPASKYEARGWGTNFTSINSLTIWLCDNGGEFGSSDQCAAAIKALRNVGTLRQGAQHSKPETRAKAQRAQNELGLPAVIVDHADAWNKILQKVAASFFAIGIGITQDTMS